MCVKVKKLRFWFFDADACAFEAAKRNFFDDVEFIFFDGWCVLEKSDCVFDLILFNFFVYLGFVVDFVLIREFFVGLVWRFCRFDGIAYFVV